MFRINVLSWRIFLVSSNHPMLLTPSGNFSIGVCDKKTQKIYINENLSCLYLQIWNRKDGECYGLHIDDIPDYIKNDLYEWVMDDEI